MLYVGLTGGIGSGKTTVAAIFELLGIPVYYADLAAKRIMNENQHVKGRLQLAFGPEVYMHGKFNRRLLAETVFDDKNKLALLNSIVHPATIADAEEWMNRQLTPYLVKEAALLFESGSDKRLDYIIGVQAPAETRIQRTMLRDSVTRGQVMDRITKQMNEEEKLSLCDYIITNDEQQMLLPQVLELHEKLIQLASRSVHTQASR